MSTSGGGFPGSGGVAGDPTNGDILITTSGGAVNEYDSSGNFVGSLTEDSEGPLRSEGTPGVNAQGYAYVPAIRNCTFGCNGIVDIYTPNSVVPSVSYKPVTSPTTTSGTFNANVDPAGGGDVVACHFEYGTDTTYGNSALCTPDPSGTHFTTPTDVSAAITGLAPDTGYHYRVVVANANGTKFGEDRTYITGDVAGLSTDPATNLTESAARLNASFVGDGSSTHYYFEWGPTVAYGNTTAAPPGDDAGSPAGPSRTGIATDLTGLHPFSTYHYRVVATNGSGTTDGRDQMFTTTPGVPSAEHTAVTAVHSDRALFHGDFNPNGADTAVHFEYVDDANFQQSAWAEAITTSPDVGIGMSKHSQNASQLVDGLTPNTLYHLRAVGTNEMGSETISSSFRTFAFTPTFVDPCPNAHARQQTGAGLLLDCRAYELVSASNAGGYDVESYLVPGETPFGGYQNAVDPPQVLYGVHNGGIPGTGNPTNRGVDPYVATRGDTGWTTRYVGIPANNPFATEPFSSTLADAASNLETLAFGGPEICSPCFEDGSTGNPIHLADGELVQGMAGSIPQPGAKPAGFIGRRLSADGDHFVFGSKSKFEADGKEGEISIYDRNLRTGETHVVSKTPGGQTMSEEGEEIGELDISADGSRIVVGHLVSESGEAKLWHLYMNVGDSGSTIDLTPGTTSGVLYDGMTGDGSRVYSTTEDELSGGDTDDSADIYRTDIDAQGHAGSPVQISTGTEGAGNADDCHPSANTVNEHWNTTSSEESCGVVAVGGGGGVAESDGTIYFLSPERLDGSGYGVEDAPNLYLARPGQAPHFVATLESGSNAPIPPSSHAFIRSYGSLSNPEGVAIDHQTGSSFVLDNLTNTTSENQGAFVAKFDSSGSLDPSFGTNGRITGAGTPTGPFLEIGDGPGSLGTTYGVPTSIAVDNNPGSPNYRDLYVPDSGNFVVDKFGPSGNYISQIEVGDYVTGVAVNQANGKVYVSGFSGTVHVYDTSGSPVAPVTFSITPNAASGIAVDSGGNSYVTDGSQTKLYDATGTFVKVLDPNASFAAAVDPLDDHVYVDEGNRVVEFDPSGTQVGAAFGSGILSKAVGVAADHGLVNVANPGSGKVAAFDVGAIPPDPRTDNPLVLDSVNTPGARRTGDFEITTSGEDAVFTSTLSLTGYDNGTRHEVFRYDAPSGELECASCNPTSEQATGEASLATNGSSLPADGRVFFNSTEGLVDRDLNEKQDVYEWEPSGFEFESEQGKFQTCESTAGCVELISAGTGTSDSALLGIGTDATDAYFFTRTILTANDANGTRVKVYDARSLGGFAQAPPPHQCQASDECHGPGSQAPGSPDINTAIGAGGNMVTAKRAHPHRHHRKHPRRRHRKSHRHG